MGVVRQAPLGREVLQGRDHYVRSRRRSRKVVVSPHPTLSRSLASPYQPGQYSLPKFLLYSIMRV